MISPVQGIAAGLLLGIAVGAGGAWYFRGVVAERDMLELVGTYTKAFEAANEQRRTEELRRQEAVANIAQEGRAQNEIIESNAVVNTTSTDGLRDDATVYARTASCDPGPARRGASATRAAMVLSDLLGEANQRSSDLAKTADAARTRGLICEKAWEALKAQHGKSS